MHWPGIASLIVLASAIVANAESAKVIKVLPHLLDLKGRSAVHPSLFDRDAYQQELRASHTNRSAIRFDIQWKAKDYEGLTLRIQAKGMKGKEPREETLEQSLKPGTFSKWTGLTLSGERYQKFGDLVSWRATLLNGTNVVAEQKSFLW